MEPKQGTQAQPWILKTPPGTSEFQAYRDDSAPLTIYTKC